MTSNGGDAVRCPAAGCTNTVEQKPAGRRRLYCSAACGAKYRKYQQEHPRNDNDAYALRIAEELQQRAGQLVASVREGRPLEALRTLQQAMDECERLRAAAVQQARDRKIRSSVLSTTLHVSPDTLSRWQNSNTRRRGGNGGGNGRPAPPENDGRTSPAARAPSPRHPEPAPAPRCAQAPPAPTAAGDSPAALFSRAMSRLHQESGLTFTALGEAVQVDRSYVYRVVTGERIPSWKVTRRFAAACAGDPDDLRPLWEAARGYQVAQPGDLHAALRGMNLAAGHLTARRLSALTDRALTEDDVTGLLSGTRVTDWPTVERLVGAMGGRCDLVRPLWEAASAHPGPSVHFFHPSKDHTRHVLTLFGLGTQP